MGDVLSEILLQDFPGRESVFDHVMEQSGHDAGQIETEIRQDMGNLQGMSEVRLARRPNLPAMLHSGEDVRPPEELHVRVGHVLLDLFLNVFKPDQGGRFPQEAGFFPVFPWLTQG